MLDLPQPVIAIGVLEVSMLRNRQNIERSETPSVKRYGVFKGVASFLYMLSMIKSVGHFDLREKESELLPVNCMSK